MPNKDLTKNSLTNSTFNYRDNREDIVYCIFCDENYKYGNVFNHKNSKSHMENRMAMLWNIPKHSEFCVDNDDECPHLVEEDNDWWCGIGFESVYGKRGELSTGKEFMENDRKPRRPMECTLAKPRGLKKKLSSGPIKIHGTKWPYRINTVKIVKPNKEESDGRGSRTYYIRYDGT